MGTPAYMSPEQARGLEVDKRTDIWAFGCCLFECLSGRKPFRGQTASDLMAEVLKSDPDWSQIPSETPHAVVTLLRRCLEKEPSRRLSGIGDIAIMLDESTRGPAASSSPPIPQPQSAPTPAAWLTGASARRLWPVTAGLLFLAIGAGVFFWKRSAPDHLSQNRSDLVRSNAVPVPPSAAVAAPAPDQKSVAVLAFANLSEDKGNEYFSDGLSEELLNVLAKVPGLKVSARTSAFHFKGKDTPIPEIAKQLDVAYVVEGSVRKSGNRVRITAQLIKAADGFHVWSDNFDRELKDIFAVQDEIAGLIAHNLALKMRVGAEGEPAVPHGGTENLEAYDLFLRGRQLWNKRTGRDLERAIGYFQQATEKDPKFALAYAGSGLCYVLLPIYEDVSQKEAYPKARAAAQRALELDPRSAEAQTALGLCSAGEDDAIGAEAAYRQALVFNPNYATAHQWYGEFLALRGRTEQAVAEARRALALDPLSPVIQCDAGEAIWYGRRYDEALLQIDKALQLSPDYPLAYTYRGMVKLIQKRYAEAITDLEKARKLESARIDTRAFLGHCYGAIGRTNEARQLIEELKTSAAKGLSVATYIALVYKGLGDKEQVFAWLERAAPNPVEGVRMLKYDPMWDDVTADPRYAALLKKHGLDK
jgi:TolB-like protein/Flp pilus assembly protein TadD